MLLPFGATLWLRLGKRSKSKLLSLVTFGHFQTAAVVQNGSLLPVGVAS